MSNSHQSVWYRFKDNPTVYQSHNWRLEIDVATQRTLLGLPYWVDIEILSDYEPDPHPEQDLIALAHSSHDGNPSEPNVVAKNPSKSKTRKKAVQLSNVSDILDKFVPADNLPDTESGRVTNPISDRVDK